MYAIDKMLDNIEIILNRIGDNDIKKEFKERYQKLRELYENMDTDNKYSTSGEIHLQFGQSDLDILLDGISALEMEMNNYIQNGTILRVNAKDVRTIDSTKKRSFTFVKIYSEALDNIRDELPIETLIHFVEQIEEKIKKYQIHSQELDQKIAKKKYEIIVRLIRNDKSLEANKIISGLGTDMKLYLIKRFKQFKDRIIALADLQLIESMVDYMQENRDSKEKNIDFWKNTILRMEDAINEEKVAIKEEEEEKKEEEEENKTYPKNEETTKRISGYAVSNKEVLDRFVQIQETIEKIIDESEQKISEKAIWLEKRKKIRQDINNRLKELKEDVKIKGQNSKIVVNESQEIELLKEKLDLENKYIKQHNKVEKCKKTLRALYKKLKLEVSKNNSTEFDVFKKVEEAISQYNKEKEVLEELECKIKKADNIEREKIEAEKETKLQKERLEQEERSKQKAIEQETKRIQKQINDILLSERQEKNRLKREMNRLSGIIEQKKSNGENTEEEEKKYEQIKTEYEKAKIKLRKRTKEVEEEVLGKSSIKKEFSAQDLAEAGFGVSVEDCSKAKKELKNDLDVMEGTLHSIK